jgi:hypothetical protein
MTTAGATDLGEHRDKSDAQAAVDQRIKLEMRKTTEDWAIWQGQAKDKAGGRG